MQVIMIFQMILNCLKEEVFIKDQELADTFRKLFPHLADIDYLVKEIKWGKLNLELVIQNGKVTAVEVISRQRIDYTKGEAVKA